MKDHCELATDLVKRAGVRGADQADVYRRPSRLPREWTHLMKGCQVRHEGSL